jgi:integrase
MAAEAWLSAERQLIDRGEWTSPQARDEAKASRIAAAAANTLAAFAERYLAERELRPNTLRGYRQLLDGRILPHLGSRPIEQITLSQIKAWRATLDPATEATNAAAYRLLRSLLASAEEEELITRAPPKIRGAGAARVKRIAQPASLDEIDTIVRAMPTRLQLFVVLAAFVGLREGELLELRRADVDAASGLVSVNRKIDKDVIKHAPGACPNCKRAISTPKTASGIRTVHVPPPFLAMLKTHLLEFTASGPNGLLFPGDRTDHMSVRYLMDRFRPAREAAGRPDLTIHHLRHTALTIAGQHGATAAELQARGGHASQAAMAIYQHGTRDRDKRLAQAIGASYDSWLSAREQQGS